MYRGVSPGQTVGLRSGSWSRSGASLRHLKDGTWGLSLAAMCYVTLASDCFRCVVCGAFHPTCAVLLILDWLTPMPCWSPWDPTHPTRVTRPSYELGPGPCSLGAGLWLVNSIFGGVVRLAVCCLYARLANVGPHTPYHNRSAYVGPRS